MKLNTKYVYSLEELTSEERKEVLEPLNLIGIKKANYLSFGEPFGWVLGTFHNKETHNAKELFYTLENIQVDCRELTEEQISNISDVFELNNFKVVRSYNNVTKTHYHLQYVDEDKDVWVNSEDEEKNIITYDKFMELFGEPKVNKSGWYRDEKSPKWLVYRDFKNKCAYGFNGWDGSWFFTKNILNHIGSNDILATKEEVEEMLKKEAIERGFVVGAEMGCLEHEGYSAKVLKEDYYLNKLGDKVLWNEFALDTSLIMKDGIWLEVVKTQEINIVQFPTHYDNKNGSIYKFCNDHKLNSWEFDIIKRVVRCRKKGLFKEDLQKTKDLIDLYLKEFEDENNT